MGSLVQLADWQTPDDKLRLGAPNSQAFAIIEPSECVVWSFYEDTSSILDAALLIRSWFTRPFAHAHSPFLGVDTSGVLSENSSTQGANEAGRSNSGSRPKVRYGCSLQRTRS